MKNSQRTWKTGASVASIVMALAALTHCKEQGAGGAGGSITLESQVRAAELEVENLQKELKEYHANSGGDSAGSEVADMDGMQAELDVLQAEYENLKDDLQEFKTEHPMPR